MAILTARRLRELIACEQELNIFIRIWGEQVDVTEERMVEQAETFDWYWAADRLLSLVGYEEFTRIVDEAKATRDKTIEIAYKKLEEATEVDDQEFQRVKKAAKLEVEKVKARAFAQLYNGEVPRETSHSEATKEMTDGPAAN